MIHRHHHAQNPFNLELLNFIDRHGQCAASELYVRFCVTPGHNKEAQRMAAKLSYLVGCEQLCRQGRGLTALYTLGPQAGVHTPSAARARAKAAPAPPAAPVRPEPVVGPSTPDRPDYRITVAPYVPGPGAALRPGALDYQRYASHGVRC